MEKIVYLDVDGTILDKNGMLSEKNQQVIQQIQEKGIGVVLATGRNFLEVQQIAEKLKLKEHLNYSICENGAYVTSIDHFKPTFLETISREDAKKLYDYLDKQNIYVMMSTYKNQGYSYSNMSQEDIEFQKNLTNVIKKFEIKALDDSFDWDAVSMIAFDSPKEKVSEFEQYFKENIPGIEFIVSRSAHRIKPLFMISRKGVDKANAIKNLNKQLKINEDNTYFFGDGMNDVTAILTFKNSFVPSSAPDYVKEVTSNIIGDASESGIGIKLEELFLKK